MNIEHKRLAEYFKALGNEQRLKLFLMILESNTETCLLPENKKANGCCSGMEKAFTHACECLNISRSTVSHHFKELQNSGLISCERRGQSTFCEINQQALQEVRHLLG